ncbi:50S ribosomal protein L25/general stress protein Ctc [Agarivorans sp. B2Z047]|uniref:50S ribosomal protein L25/general stress protein Ctc n=1 Tax=Agarivorans sp. B2Z047 TaxID=2652721 RepID=UPI00128D3EFB|nr:50S ribosomal protein L25/general stress protein Ctc [Agarivorans sp. B2Z047]MPW28907.1 50S ribosomal protein L25/general stress protein Ctc [Agarivorans sp. B2Z047]UQN41464.1 50S ribosomal protein L25/general stress protein Ctc [Agarivorans sp. B2Z047]
MSNIKLDAELRTDLGKGASRRLRHEEKVPAIVYGAGQQPVSITLEQRHVMKAQEAEAFYSSIITLSVAGEAVDVLVKDMQRHAYKPRVQHIDFQRVDNTKAIHKAVPLHFLNEDSAEAVKNGGKVHHLATEIEVSCLAKDLPEYIEVDVANLELGSSLHISDIALPEGVTSVELAKGEDHDQAVVSITTPKGTSEEASDSDSEEEATEE